MKQFKYPVARQTSKQSK